MTINDFDTSNITTEPKTVVSEAEKPISAPVDSELEHTAVHDILGLDKTEAGKYHDKVDILLEWAKGQTKDHSLENLKWVIRDLQFKIGSPPLGQKLASWLAEYAYLELESKKLNSRLEDFKKG